MRDLEAALRGMKPRLLASLYRAAKKPGAYPFFKDARAMRILRDVATERGVA